MDQAKPLCRFLVIGDPNPSAFLDIIQTVEPYADILELGIPFSDPIADGSVIQAADQRALSQGTAFMNCFDLITQVRQNRRETDCVVNLCKHFGSW